MRTSLIVGSMVFLISFGVYLSDNNRDKGKSSILPQSPSTHSLSYAETPLSFEPNLGQTNEEVKYLSRGEGYALFLATDEAVLSLGRDDEAGESISDVVRLQLIDALPNPTVRGIDPLGGRSNYFIGNDPTRWQRDVPHYTKVSYGEIYKGIDLVYYGTTQQQLEYDFIVSPGADPNDISLNFDGADSLYIDAEGKLILMMVGGEVVFDAPVTYQETNGEREFIDSRYLIGEAHQVTFDIDAYDQSRPLTIDPVLSYSTYMGGSGNEYSAAIAIDGAGSAYVTGNTESLNYPTQNAAQSTLGGGAKDVFVTKLDPTGSAIAYSTYLGGSGIDRGNDIKVDSAGNAFIAGYTVSLLDFPLQNSLQSYGGGNSDAFLVKLDPSGSTILYSTLLGGNNNDAALEIQVDDTGNMYLAGYTTSTTFPVLNPIQSTNAGGEDAFLTKINPSGSSIIYSTYLRGRGVFVL